jgi:hypothetical protein
VRTVEFTFQANFVPGRHLSKFREVTLHGNTNAEPRDGAQLAYTSESIRHSHVNL